MEWCTFADQISNPTSRPAQFWISCINSIGFPSSYQSEQHRINLVGTVFTICRPLMPQMKSNHGSMARCGLVFLRTWKPKPLPGVGGRSSTMGRNLLSHDMEILEFGGQWAVGGAVGGMGNRGCRTSCLAFVVSINNASNTRNHRDGIFMRTTISGGPRYPHPTCERNVWRPLPRRDATLLLRDGTSLNGGNWFSSFRFLPHRICPSARPVYFRSLSQRLVCTQERSIPHLQRS